VESQFTFDAGRSMTSTIGSRGLVSQGDEKDSKLMMSITQHVNKLHDLGSRNWNRYDMKDKMVYSPSNFKGNYAKSANTIFNEAITTGHLSRSIAFNE
jgi:hypothetical protein